MQEINNLLGAMIFIILLPIALMGSLFMLVMKKNDKLRETTKEVAREKGKDVAVKLVEWVLKKR